MLPITPQTGFFHAELTPGMPDASPAPGHCRRDRTSANFFPSENGWDVSFNDAGRGLCAFEPVLQAQFCSPWQHDNVILPPPRPRMKTTMIHIDQASYRFQENSNLGSTFGQITLSAAHNAIRRFLSCLPNSAHLISLAGTFS